MRNTLLLFIIFSLVFMLQSRAQSPAPKVVLVIADGIPADVIERLKPPAIQDIIREGKYMRAFVGGATGTYTETPTISAPGYNDMLTGTWAYKHNVWDNEDQHPNYNYPSIFRILKTQRPKSKTAIFSTWEDNRTMLLGSGLPATVNLQIDYAFDGFEKDTVQFPHEPGSLHNHRIDDHVVQLADSVIRSSAPDLSWIYLEYTDDVGHRTGTGAAFDSAVLLLDAQMKKIHEAIQFRERQFSEKWLLVITTDHGRDKDNGMNHGGQSERERTTWIVLNKPLTNTYAKSTSPGIVDIVPSVCGFMGIKPPARITREWDGTPFLGPVSLAHAGIKVRGDSLTATWTSFAPKEPVHIYIVYGNKVKTGGNDQFQLLGHTLSGKRSFTKKIPALGSKPFFKVVVEGKNNSANVWYSSVPLPVGKP